MGWGLLAPTPEVVALLTVTMRTVAAGSHKGLCLVPSTLQTPWVLFLPTVLCSSLLLSPFYRGGN